MDQTTHNESVKMTWAVVLFCLSVIFAKGFFAFFMVGDLGMPTWDYRPVKDIPGESPYAIYEKLPFPQHVMGKEGN